jgi:hypothetical protein
VYGLPGEERWLGREGMAKRRAPLAQRRNDDSLSLLWFFEWQNEGMVILWVCCVCIWVCCVWFLGKISSLLCLVVGKNFGFAVVEWVALFCLVSGKNIEHGCSKLTR